MGKYSEIVKGKNESGKPESKKARKPEINQTGNVESSNSSARQSSCFTILTSDRQQPKSEIMIG